MDPSTQPHTRESDTLLKCSQTFCITTSFLRIHILKRSAFWLLSLCNKHEQTSLNHCTGLFPSIYNCSLPEFLGPVGNNLAILQPGSCEARCLIFTWIYFHSIFHHPIPCLPRFATSLCCYCSLFSYVPHTCLRTD